MRKKIILGISGGISLILFLTLLIISNHMASSLPDQAMAERWSKDGGVAQVSCFFAADAGVTEETFLEFEYFVGNTLQEASIVQESENPSARLWADAYSAYGKITLTSGKTNLEADAIGIGGDFFLFHPVKLLSGAYFSGSDVNQDYCIIDREAAWQLFGSNDVAGMYVYIGGEPHIITGVIEREKGKIAEAAGLDGTLVYVSYQTLKNYGICHGINHYEIIMPDPVDQFAMNLVREKLGRSEKDTEIIENTSRFSLLNRLKTIGAFGTRSMNGKAIIYPYWENMARGCEDILGVLTLFMIILLLYPAVLFLVFFIIWWKHKGWTIKEVCILLKDKAERFVEKRRAAGGSRREKRRKML